MENSMEAPHTVLKIELTNDPAIPLLRICLKECKLGYNKGTCMPMFIAALVTIAKLGNSQDVPLLMNGLKKYGRDPP
jgi:hypothetical protein